MKTFLTLLRMIARSESGVGLPMALVLLGIGSAIVVPLLVGVASNLVALRNVEVGAADQHAVSAAVEDAIWNIVYGDFTSTVLASAGDSTTYTLDQPVNGVQIQITVERKNDSTLASDDFESNSWSGGAGWTGDWIANGSAIITKSGAAYQGEYHLRLQEEDGYAKRAVDLSCRSSATVEFWARVDEFDDDDQVEVQVSPNNSNWTTVRTLTEDDDDDTYRFESIDLSPFTMSSEFWIAFDADIEEDDGKLFVDDLKIIGHDWYEISVTAGDETVLAKVVLRGGGAEICRWDTDAVPSP